MDTAEGRACIRRCLHTTPMRLPNFPLCALSHFPHPQKAQAGASVILQYNRLGGPIKGFDIPLEQALTLRVGA